MSLGFANFFLMVTFLLSKFGIALCNSERGVIRI
jgi:hypothetical protein